MDIHSFHAYVVAINRGVDECCQGRLRDARRTFTESLRNAQRAVGEAASRPVPFAVTQQQAPPAAAVASATIVVNAAAAGRAGGGPVSNNDDSNGNSTISDTDGGDGRDTASVVSTSSPSRPSDSSLDAGSVMNVGYRSIPVPPFGYDSCRIRPCIEVAYITADPGSDYSNPVVYARAVARSHLKVILEVLLFNVSVLHHAQAMIVAHRVRHRAKLRSSNRSVTRRTDSAATMALFVGGVSVGTGNENSNSNRSCSNRGGSIQNNAQNTEAELDRQRLAAVATLLQKASDLYAMSIAVVMQHHVVIGNDGAEDDEDIDEQQLERYMRRLRSVLIENRYRVLTCSLNNLAHVHVGTNQPQTAQRCLERLYAELTALGPDAAGYRSEASRHAYELMWRNVCERLWDHDFVTAPGA